MSGVSFPKNTLPCLRQDLNNSLVEFVSRDDLHLPCDDAVSKFSVEKYDDYLLGKDLERFYLRELNKKINGYFMDISPLVSRREFNSFLFWPGYRIARELKAFPLTLVGECLSFCNAKENACLAAVNSHLNRGQFFFERNQRIEGFRKWICKLLGPDQFAHYTATINLKGMDITEIAKHILEQVDHSQLCCLIAYVTKTGVFCFLKPIFNSLMTGKIKTYCIEGNLNQANELLLLLLDPAFMNPRKIAFWLRENCSHDFATFENVLRQYARNVDLETLETLVSEFSPDSPDPILTRQVSDCLRSILKERGGDPIYKSEIRGVDGSVFHRTPHGQRGPEGWLVTREAQQGRTCWYEIAQRMFPLFNRAHPFVNPHDERREREVTAYSRVWDQYSNDLENPAFIKYQRQLCLSLGIQDRLVQTQLNYLEERRHAIPTTWLMSRIVHNLIYRDVYHFQHAVWNPSKTFAELLEEVPLLMSGFLGALYFNTRPILQPKRYYEGQKVYSWPAGSTVDQGCKVLHVIKVVGGRKSSLGEERICFIDPNDSSDPDNRDEQRLYEMPYQTLRENVADVLDQQSPPTEYKPYAYSASLRLCSQKMGFHCDRYQETQDVEEIHRAIYIAETFLPFSVKKERLQFILTKYISHTPGFAQKTKDFNSEEFRTLLLATARAWGLLPSIIQRFENTPEGENRDVWTRRLLHTFSSFESFRLSAQETHWINSELSKAIRGP